LTTTLEPEAFWEEAAWVAVVEAALVVLVLLFELLPQAASRTVAANVGMSSVSRWRIVGLLRASRVGFSPFTHKDQLRTIFFPLSVGTR
jgi:hypothetical protein